MKYYAGIGSRDTPKNVLLKMRDIASFLELNNFILRSGGAKGADTAFESGVVNPELKNIYLPFRNFNGHKSDNKSYIYVEKGDPELDPAFYSLKLHPSKGKMNDTAKAMMMRNYFQIHGLKDQSKSQFVICWTPDATNGKTILTSWDSGGSGQCIRLAALENIPVYNLEDNRYKDMDPRDILNLILYNLENEINPDSCYININTNTTSLF